MISLKLLQCTLGVIKGMESGQYYPIQFDSLKILYGILPQRSTKRKRQKKQIGQPLNWHTSIFSFFLKLF